MLSLFRRKQPLNAFFEITSKLILDQGATFYRQRVVPKIQEMQQRRGENASVPSDAQEVECFYETVIWEIFILEQALFTFPDLDHSAISDQLYAHLWRMFLGTGGAKVDQAEAEGLCSRTRARLKRYLGCYAFTPPKDGQLRGTMTYEGAISIHRALGYKDDDVVSVMILMLELANHFVSTREVRLYEKAIEMTDMRLARRIR